MTKLEKMHWFAEEINKLYEYYRKEIAKDTTDEEDDQELKDYGVDLSGMVQQKPWYEAEGSKVRGALYNIYWAFSHAKEPKSEVDLQIEKLKAQGEELSRQIEILEQKRREENG